MARRRRKSIEVKGKEEKSSYQKALNVFKIEIFYIHIKKRTSDAFLQFVKEQIENPTKIARSLIDYQSALADVKTPQTKYLPKNQFSYKKLPKLIK